jgi:hypothetical protein
MQITDRLIYKNQKNEIYRRLRMDSGYLKVADFQADSEAMEELSGLNFGFDMVRIPTGGLMFETVGDEGRPELVKEIEGVVVYHHAINSFYKDEYTGGTNPPDCGSLDGKNGTGIPGGNCRDCQYNKFGSRKEGRGKACKNRRRVYLLREGEMLPCLLTLPTGSLKEFSSYIKHLLTMGKRSCGVVTRVSLKRAVSSSGIQYGQADFSTVRDLTPDEVRAVIQTVDFIKGRSLDMAFEEELNAEE